MLRPPNLLESPDVPVTCETVSDNRDLPWFNCLDESRGSRAQFLDGSYSTENVEFIFKGDKIDHFSTELDCLNLFEFNFDKGTIVIEELSDIFKMMRYFFMQMEYAAKTSSINVTMGITTRKSSCCTSYRKGIVRFLLHLGNFIRRVGSKPQFDWLKRSLFKKISAELDSFLLFCGPINLLPDHIINNPTKPMWNETSYHIFHCHLDLKWLYITLLRQLILLEDRNIDDQDSQESCPRSHEETLETALSNIVTELIGIALKRFQHTSIVDLSSKSAFSCPCVKKFWRVLQTSCDNSNSQQRTGPFWSYVNRVCEEIVSQNETSTNSVRLESNILQKYDCSNPPIFVLWLLKYLTSTYELANSSVPVSNYHLLESSLKLFLKTDAPEMQHRVVLLLVEKILRSEWEERTEPLVLLWEYFHKRMNSSFLIPGAAIDEIAIIGKNASAILKNLTKKLESVGNDEHMDSFHLFLRILGVIIKKWRNSADGLRCWNQLKGRLLSKFSASKFSTFNEIGLYHFILIFLTLAMSADLQEMGDKLQTSLQSLHVQELNEMRIKLILRGHMALIFLFLRHDQDISSISSHLLTFLEIVRNHPLNSSGMLFFIEEFQDLIHYTDNLQLGQCTLIGNWIPTCLSNCGESEANRLLNSISSLATKLNSNLSVEIPMKQDCQLVILSDSIYDHVVPYLKNICSSSSCPYVNSNIAATLTTIFLKLSVLSTKNKSRAAEIFTHFIGRETVNAKILCRYVGLMYRSNCIYDREVFGNNNISLIRSWLRCIILLPDEEDSDHLCLFTAYIISVRELRHILPDEFSKETFSQQDYFETFLTHLQSKYNSCDDVQSKNKFVNQFSNYFTYADKWLSHTLKSSVSTNMALNIYQNIGKMFFKIPQMLYTKSKSNSLLQNFLDSLLLSSDFRNHKHNIPQYIISAINKTIHLYISGLFALDPENDTYIERCIRELIIIYTPRLVTTRGSIFAYGNAAETSLLKCFENSKHFELISKTILEILSNNFLKKRAKIPHQSAFQVLIFLDNLIKQYKGDDRVVISVLKNAFDRICDVVMFCDISSPCRTKAKDIVTFILNLDSVRSNVSVGNTVIDAFGRLCQEHLAFTSRNLFDLFEDIIRVAPDLVLRFLPEFTNKVKEVENKRGVGYDRALRKGLERIEDTLKKIRGDLRSYN